MFTRDKKPASTLPSASPATMEELSRLVGVSRVTVSKVLNGRSGVAPETRQRVLEAVSSTDFQPNSMARGLRRQRTERLGVVITGQNGWGYSNWYYVEYLRGILMQVETLGLNIMLYTQRSSSHLAEDASRAVRAREVDGLLLVGSGATRSQIEPLLHWKIPFIVLGALPSGIATNSIYYDNVGGARLAVEHLLHLGHRRIGVIGQVSEFDARFSIPRMEGVISALRDAGLQPLGGRNTPMTIPEAVDLACDHKPCAFVSLLRGAHYQLQQNGLRIPQDVALVSFDNYPGTEFEHLTVVEQPLFEIGQRAVEKVTDMLERGEHITASELLPMRLIARGSSGAPVMDTTHG